MITSSSQQKPHLIGGPIEILEIKENSGKYIQENKYIFIGNIQRFSDLLKDDILRSTIQAGILKTPILEKISL